MLRSATGSSRCRRTARHQAGAVSQAGSGAAAGHCDLVQHLDHSARDADRRDARKFPRDFMITHFFNPPRYMRLLEVVPGLRRTRRLAGGRASSADVAMGKSVVACKDAPGFIANRVGVLLDDGRRDRGDRGGLTIEEADAVMGTPVRRSEDRRVRADGSRGARPHAAHQCEHGRRTAAG